MSSGKERIDVSAQTCVFCGIKLSDIFEMCVEGNLVFCRDRAACKERAGVLAKASSKPKLTIEVKDIEGDPVTRIWYLEILSKDGVWTESFGCREHLELFIKGFRAAFAFTEWGYLEWPEIPR